MSLEISPYILVTVTSLLAAQALKYVILLVRGQGFDPVRQVYASGGIPSAHSASVAALLTTIGLIDGVESGLFGIAFLFAIIVMYDAIMVRRSVGEQGNALQKLIRMISKEDPLPRAANGHTVWWFGCSCVPKLRQRCTGLLRLQSAAMRRRGAGHEIAQWAGRP